MLQRVRASKILEYSILKHFELKKKKKQFPRSSSIIFQCGRCELKNPMLTCINLSTKSKPNTSLKALLSLFIVFLFLLFCPVVQGMAARNPIRKTANKRKQNKIVKINQPKLGDSEFRNGSRHVMNNNSNSGVNRPGQC